VAFRDVPLPARHVLYVIIPYLPYLTNSNSPVNVQKRLSG